MALYACEYIQNEYIGDGSTKLYSFTFEYATQTEVTVSLRDPITKYFYPIDRSQFRFVNPTTIEFSQAPAAQTSRINEKITNIRISRTTDLSAMVASFYPGSAIRAQDLNNNFEQLRLAIIESGCSIPQPILDFLEENYWDKNADTIYSDQTWVTDDSHVASTKAIKGFVVDYLGTDIPDLEADIIEINNEIDVIQGDITNINSDINSINDELDTKWTKVSETIESTESWVSNNSKVATTGAIQNEIQRIVDGVDTGVSKLVAGENITLSPSSGLGVVTINSPRSPEEDASVIISAFPPTDNVPGDLWWSTDDGRLYIWYIDSDSSQWVDASPDSLGVNYWLKSGSTLTPVSSGDSIEIGGSITAAGALKLGDVVDPSSTTAKGLAAYQDGAIFLQKASGQSGSFITGWKGTDTLIDVTNDGGINAAGQITAGTTTGAVGTKGANLGPDGYVSIMHTSRDSSNCFSIVNTNSQKFACEIKGDGSINAAGGISLGGDSIIETGSLNVYQNSNSSSTPVFNGGWNAGSGRNITSTIYSNGTATFTNYITATGYNAEPANSVDSGLTLRNPDNAAITIDLKANGTATFAGSITSTEGSGSVYMNTGGRALIAYDSSASGSQPKVTIDKAGSATFAGAVRSGDAIETATSTFGVIDPSGQLVLQNNFGNNTKVVFSVFDGTYVSSAAKIQMLASGEAVFKGTVTATVVPPSDARFKENITPAKPQLADVVALGGLLKNYDWNDQAPLNEEIRSQRQLGLVAQEAAEVCPSIVKDIHRTKTVEVTPAVTGPKGRVITEAVTEEVDDSYKGISTDALIMKLIGAVTEQNTRIEALEAKVKLLEGGNN